MEYMHNLPMEEGPIHLRDEDEEGKLAFSTKFLCKSIFYRHETLRACRRRLCVSYVSDSFCTNLVCTPSRIDSSRGIFKRFFLRRKFCADVRVLVLKVLTDLVVHPSVTLPLQARFAPLTHGGEKCQVFAVDRRSSGISAATLTMSPPKASAAASSIFVALLTLVFRHA
jgi:hypothetical protein